MQSIISKKYFYVKYIFKLVSFISPYTLKFYQTGFYPINMKIYLGEFKSAIKFYRVMEAWNWDKNY